jgi:hypothetical protein
LLSSPRGCPPCWGRWPLLLLLIFFARLSAFAVTPDVRQYPVTFMTGSPPADGDTATATFPQRAAAFTQRMACGEENQVASFAMAGPYAGGASNIDTVISYAMAKVAWIKQNNAPCEGSFDVDFRDGSTSDFLQVNGQNFASAAAVSSQLATTFGAACGGGNVTLSIAPGPDTPFLQVQSHVSVACLEAQANALLRSIQVGNAQPGTDALPCDVVGTEHGDWDMRMKQLIRVLYLDRPRQTDRFPGSVLTAVGDDGLTTADYVSQNLITVDGYPGPDSYAWEACGDNEKNTGSAQDREDSHDPGNGFLDSVGDLLTWLLRRLILIAAFLGIGGVIAAAVGLIGLIPAVIAVVGVAAILVGTFQETENHRLMIESTRFLNNQAVIDSLGKDNAPYIGTGQYSVKVWLLAEFQTIAKNDFVEFNARPYHGFALEAIRNLADFSEDADVRTGAQMILEYSAAKYAAGSNQGRRQQPFRRHFAAVNCIDNLPCPDLASDAPRPPLMFNDFYQLGDSEISEGLLFLGQNQQLPGGRASVGALHDAYAAATARFLPAGMITDLGIQKQSLYLQKIHHAGYEAVSSGPSALISAGGIETGHAYFFSIAGVGIKGGSISDSADDLGAALPTSVMFTGAPTAAEAGPGKTSLEEFLSFRGTVKTEGSNEETFDDNLCVWKNLACGIGVRIPHDMLSCFSHAGSTPWYFFDSSLCVPYKVSPRFFLALYLVCGQADCLQNLDASASGVNTTSAGFVEIVDNPSTPFLAFQSSVQSRNPLGGDGYISGLGAGCVGTGACNGAYHTASGHTLQLALRGHKDDSSHTGILSVDGVAEKDTADWPLAEGDVLNSSGNGVITIHNPRLNTQMILDFSDPDHPCRRTAPSAPCTQS